MKRISLDDLLHTRQDLAYSEQYGYIMKLLEKEFTTFPPIICRKLFFHSTQLFFPYIFCRIKIPLYSIRQLNYSKLLSYKLLPRFQASAFIFPPLFCRPLHGSVKRKWKCQHGISIFFQSYFSVFIHFLARIQITMVMTISGSVFPSGISTFIRIR